jgi:hypothetical protein
VFPLSFMLFNAAYWIFYVLPSAHDPKWNLGLHSPGGICELWREHTHSN